MSARVGRKDKSTFYSWKQVMKMPHTLNEAVIHQSHEWLSNRDEYLKKAKSKFRDDFNVTKRVIIKQSRWALSADEVTMAEKMKRFENLLTLCYCLQLTEMIKRLSRELCFGCMFDTEGERDHTCEMSEQLVEEYFNMALSDVDDGEVHEHWIKLLLEDPSFQDVRDFNLVPYRFEDYRDSQFKTSQWKEGLKERIEKMLKLDKRM